MYLHLAEKYWSMELNAGVALDVCPLDHLAIAPVLSTYK